MKQHPIIFSGPMVRAILGNRKSQTRRVLKQTELGGWPIYCDGKKIGAMSGGNGEPELNSTPVEIGDQLWVRESFSYDRLDIDHDAFMPPWFWADGNPDFGDWTKPKPSIFMPRIYSRITLTVTDVRVQRLQDITVLDCFSEGIARPRCLTDPDIPVLGSEVTLRDNTVGAFRTLWDSINGKKHPWASNPWIVAYTFTHEQRNIDQ